jgi:hypothetical protein
MHGDIGGDMNHDDVPRLIALREWPDEPRQADEQELPHTTVPNAQRWRRILRWITTVASLLLLPPFLLLAVAPMLLLLAPVALICIPFVVPAMLSGSIAARSEEKKRASWRPVRRPLRALH